MLSKLHKGWSIDREQMLHLRIIAVLIVESLNYITDGAWNQFNDLTGNKKKQVKNSSIARKWKIYNNNNKKEPISCQAE